MINRELDRLVQMLHLGQMCHICKVREAQAIHHIISRSNMMLRYEPLNLLPVCHQCHRDIHDKGIDISDDIKQWDWLHKVKNMSYRDYLTFEIQMTEKEYFKICKQRLKKLNCL